MRSPRRTEPLGRPGQTPRGTGAKALKQETRNTNRVTEAVPLGADAVRKAQLQNRVEEIRRSTPAGPEQDHQVQAATDNAEAQHRQEVLNTALQTGIAYQNQLELIGSRSPRWSE
jgi:hypothetical protein